MTTSAERARSEALLIGSIVIFFVLLVIVTLIITDGRTTLCGGPTVGMMPIIAASVGSFVAVCRRIATKYQSKYPIKYPRKESGLIGIIVNDFKFRSFATLSILSFVYASVQGACFGAATGYLIQSVQIPVCGHSEFVGTAGESVGLSGVSILALISARFVIEGYALVYRVAGDISVYTQNNVRNNEHKNNP